MSHQGSRFSRSIVIVFAALFLNIPATAQAVSPQLFGGLQWRLIGPFRGGRAAAVTGVPGDGVTFYFGSVDGGVWKTIDAGVTWKPVFDGQPIASIGALEVAPSDPNVLYAGTGESDIRSALSSGDGVYKSSDGGQTWKNVGLHDSRQISRIVIDPRNPDVVYVGALGHAYGPNDERGVFKSTDGGNTWKRVLDEGPSIGVSDLAIAASAPNIPFAGTWNTHRPPWSTYAPLPGPGGGIYRSIDRGATWTQLSGNGLPDGDWGRVGVAAPQIGVPARGFAIVLNKALPRVFVNAEVVHSSGVVVDQEGCLSVAERWFDVSRAASVTVRAQDVKGKHFEVGAAGRDARALQHEIDHLSGILVIDRVREQLGSLVRQRRRANERELAKVAAA